MTTAKNLIRLGDYVLMGAYAQVIDHYHGFKAGQIIREQNAKIGNELWIGAGAKVLMSCHIGNGAIIGSNAVVGRHTF